MYKCELLKVTNSANTETKYYFIVCDQRKQVSKKRYDQRYDAADGISCLYTTSRMYKGVKYMHYYTTVTFDNLASIES